MEGSLLVIGMTLICVFGMIGIIITTREKNTMSQVSLNNDNQVEPVEKRTTSKPENMEQLIVLFMEMNINYRILASRLDKVESRLNTLLSESFKKDQVTI